MPPRNICHNGFRCKKQKKKIKTPSNQLLKLNLLLFYKNELCEKLLVAVQHGRHGKCCILVKSFAQISLSYDS